MICKFIVENYRAFAEKTELDFYANGNIKRMDYNYVRHDKNILKTIGIYGPNNAGKTCLVDALMDLVALMSNAPHGNFGNAFADKGDATHFSVEYCVNGRFYVYSCSYDNKRARYEKESLFQKIYAGETNKKERIFERGEEGLFFLGMTSAMKRANVMNLFSPSFPFMLLFNDADNETMKQAKKDYIDFAESLLFLKMETSVDMMKTINLLKHDPKAASFVKEFVKNCDLHIEDFGFDERVISDADIEDELSKVSADPTFVKETLKLYSKHNGHRVPSVFFDSLGTKKLIALAGYIYEALHQGKVLVIDEIESSLHHILTKSIVAMFNNMLNQKAQLVFTTHDVLLLDLKELFRKDQIYLIDIADSSSSKAFRMSERFTSRDASGIRGDEDITQYYLKGQFGAIPTSDLFAALEEVTSDE